MESCAGSEGVDAIKGKADPVPCDIAVPIYDGDILVGPETARRIRGKLTLYDRRLSRFKNVKEEVRVFSLVRGSAENL